MVATCDNILRISIKCRNAYKDILPVKVYRKKRLRRVVEKGWTNNLSSIVWKKIKLPCCLRWKVANVRRNDIVCEGSCVECKLTIICRAEEKKLHFTIKHYDAEFEHDPKNKRIMSLADKEKILQMLKGKSAFAVGNELADELMDAGDPHCPLVPTGNTVRIIKHRTDDSNKSTIDALLALKKQYPNAISFIGLDPFFFMYCTELQKAFYLGECFGKGRITLSVDATGLGLFKNDDYNLYQIE